MHCPRAAIDPLSTYQSPIVALMQCISSDAHFGSVDTRTQALPIRCAWLMFVCSAHRDAASTELELDDLQEAHKALIRAEALNPEMYGPLANALDRLMRWLHNTAEGGGLQPKKNTNDQWEVVFKEDKVGHLFPHHAH